MLAAAQYGLSVCRLPGKAPLMLKHIVMWKLKDHAEGADKASNIAKAVALLRGAGVSSTSSIT